MRSRQMYIGIAGVLLVAFGLAAMLYPIHLGLYDMYGIKVNCGAALNTQLAQATQIDSHAATQCESALLLRRAWAIPTVAIGWLLITGFLVMWVHNEQRRLGGDAEPPHYVPHPEIAGPVTGRWTGPGRLT